MKTQTPKKLPPFGPLDETQAKRVRQLAGLLARPALEAQHVQSIHQMVSVPDWVPLPRIAPLYPILPMIAHHAACLRIPADRLIEGLPPIENSMSALLGEDVIRRRTITELLQALIDYGIPKIMLVKGAALAPRYPSPALRKMEDADLVVEENHAGLAEKCFRQVGWKWNGVSWTHSQGLFGDLQIVGPGLGRMLWDSARPHPHFPEGVYQPDDAGALLLIAAHGSRHRGLRVWRDVCDAQLLLDNGRSDKVARGAMELAAKTGWETELQGFLLFLNSWTVPVRKLPTGNETEEARAQASYLERVAADRISEVAFHSLLSLMASPGDLARGVWKTGKVVLKSSAQGKATRPEAESEGQRDVALGNVPGANHPARQWLKARLLLRIVRAGQLGHYRRLIDSSGSAGKKPKVFPPARNPGEGSRAE